MCVPFVHDDSYNRWACEEESACTGNFEQFGKRDKIVVTFISNKLSGRESSSRPEAGLTNASGQ